MTKTRKNKGKGQSDIVKMIRGRCPISTSLTAASAAGAFVVTRVEVDTTMCDAWTKLGQVFSQWKICMLEVHYVPIVGTTTKGLSGIGFLRDPVSTTPGTTQVAIQLEDATMDSIWKKQTLRVKPTGKWYFTRDTTATTEDRLEMPGDIIFWTDNTDTAQVTGVAYLEFALEFRGMGNSTVYPQKMIIKITTPDAKSTKEEVTNVNNEEIEQPPPTDTEKEMNSLLLSMMRRITRLQAARAQTTTPAKLEEGQPD